VSKTTLVQKVKERLREAKRRKPRAFRGFKAVLRLQSEELQVSAPVRYARITSRKIDEELKITPYSQSLGVPVRLRVVGNTRKAWLTEDGREVPKDDVIYLQEVDGDMIPVELLKRTSILEVEDYIPYARLDEFLIEAIIEVWSEEDVPSLYKVATYLQRRDVAGVCRFSFGRSFKEYYGLIYPRFGNGKFVLVMALTRTVLTFNHMMDIEEANAPKKKPAVKKPVGTIRIRLDDFK